MKQLALLLFGCIACMMAFAQSPQSFHYQSVVRDGNGDVVVNQPVSFQVSLISGSATGTIMYVETHAATTNSFGLVSLAIGEGTLVSGSFTSIDWASAEHFIKVEVDISGGTSFVDMGTMQLLSVPYALHSKTSEDAFSGNYIDLTGVPTDVSTFNNDAGYITNPDDADADPTNELQVLSVSNDTLFLSNGGFVSLSGYSDTLWSISGNNIYNTNTGKVGIGTTTPPGKLVVKGDSTLNDSVPLFEVKDRTGATVFVVYPDSVRIFVGDDASKTNKGAFAVSGRNTSKQVTNNYFCVTPDSVRVFLDSANTKGGFAVKSFGANQSKDFMSVYMDTAQVIDPSENRILWYPAKSAFLSGRVLIQHPDSVGTNSFSTGYESKSVGNWSQALGYHAVSRGNYSTAIGKNVIANGNNSFAFGVGARANNEDSYAFGAFSEAIGLGSFAFGNQGRDSLGPTGRPTSATGDYSLAFGLGASSTGAGSIAFGAGDSSIGPFSLAMGFFTKAKGWYSNSMGFHTISDGLTSVAMGWECKATADHAFAMGKGSEASGYISFATGYYSKAVGGASVAMGIGAIANQYGSVAIGNSCTADGDRSTAFGYYSLASGTFSTSFGQGTVASGESSTSTGLWTTASGAHSFVSGKGCIASGFASATFGYYNQATSAESFCTGTNSVCNGSGSAAMGVDLVVNGGYGAFATGFGSKAPANSTLASGYYTLAGGANSFATGASTVTTNDVAAAFGASTKANGIASTSMGVYTVSQPYASLIIGRYNIVAGDSMNWVNTDPVFVIGNGIDNATRYNCFTVLKNGKTAIGHNAPSEMLDVNGNARFRNIGSGAYTGPVNRMADGTLTTSTSDARLKENVAPLKNGLNKVMQLQGVTFNWKDKREPGTKIGFIAQEVNKVVPELVFTNPVDGYMGVNYGEITAVLTEAIKEQQKMIELQQKEIEALKDKINDLELTVKK